MRKYLIPNIQSGDLKPMLQVAMIGALIASIYGIIHDQITYSISPEYFTKLKFHQFSYVDFGLHPRILVAEIGILATWWVGFMVAWFLARRLIPNQRSEKYRRQLAIAFAIVFGCGIGATSIGYRYGLLLDPAPILHNWSWDFYKLGINDGWSFVRVAYIHNSSYLGGLVGLILALLTVRPIRTNLKSTTEPK